MIWLKRRSTLGGGNRVALTWAPEFSSWPLDLKAIKVPDSEQGGAEAKHRQQDAWINRHA
jgi:hypothetical protein